MALILRSQYCAALFSSFYRNYFKTNTMSNPIVEVAEGKLKGQACTTSNNFEFFKFIGVPYAKPPVSDLRFAAPVPAESWEGVRDATKDCNKCAQFDKTTQSVIGDEDCLFLNVYTPKLSSDHIFFRDCSYLPVMVFIHGGGFLFGHGTDDSAHGPDYLVEKDVVIVSINYRLGVLGFLSMDCKDAPGNMGLKDQVQALKWVQNNIVKFNGNPDDVTIFGFSAGAASVEYLLLSPLAKGLFHKAIAQSGSTLLPWAYNNKVKDLSYKLPITRGVTLNTDQEVLQFLKEMSTEDLILASMKVLSTDSWRGGIHFGFVPTVEKPKDWVPLLDKKPYDLLLKGNFTKVPFLTGFCTREGLLTVANYTPRFKKLLEERNFIDFLPFDVDESEKKEIENKFQKVYLEGDQNNEEDDSYAIDFFSDVDFFGGGYVSASLIAKHNQPVFFYEFSYDGGLNYLKKKYNINRKGACHGDDGGYLIKSTVLDGKISKTDETVRDRLVEMWTNFAKFGDPTPQPNVLIPAKWEPLKENDPAYLYIDDKLTMKKEPNPARAQLFKELYAKYDPNA